MIFFYQKLLKVRHHNFLEYKVMFGDDWHWPFSSSYFKAYTFFTYSHESPTKATNIKTGNTSLQAIKPQLPRLLPGSFNRRWTAGAFCHCWLPVTGHFLKTAEHQEGFLPHFQSQSRLIIQHSIWKQSWCPGGNNSSELLILSISRLVSASPAGDEYK